MLRNVLILLGSDPILILKLSDSGKKICNFKCIGKSELQFSHINISDELLGGELKFSGI